MSYLSLCWEQDFVNYFGGGNILLKLWVWLHDSLHIYKLEVSLYFCQSITLAISVTEGAGGPWRQVLVTWWSFDSPRSPEVTVPPYSPLGVPHSYTARSYITNLAMLSKCYINSTPFCWLNSLTPFALLCRWLEWI